MISRFAGCLYTVVTRIAGISDVVMRETGGQPGIGAMTFVTAVRCRHMRVRLARRLHTVMATRTGSCHTTMIKVRWYPGYGGMTIITLRRRCDVARGFTPC